MKTIALAPVLALIATPTLAHTGQGVSGFLVGVSHPFSGADHLLAMIAVGLWSGLALPRHFWMGPAVFVMAMVGGVGFGWAGFGLPLAEPMILASVIVFGALAMLARPDAPWGVTVAALGTVAALATAHGYVHAIEARGATPGYLVGFLLASISLHLVGLGLAGVAAGSRSLQRLLGGVLAVAGLMLALG